MSDRSTGSASAPATPVGQPPCRPPLEIIEVDSQWLVREYHLKRGNATVFERFPGRIDAMRAANDRMYADRHPCLLRWDDHDIVGDLYWNELFEQLHVEYSELLGAWVVVPEADHFVFQSGTDVERVCEAARVVQRQYDFKQISVFDEEGTRRETFNHRFIRHDIAASGVRFERGRPLATSEPSPDDERVRDTGRAGPDESVTSPTSTLMAAIPDLTELEAVETSGTVFRYRATWDNEQLSRIALLNPAYVSDRAIVRQFTHVIDDWQTLSDRATVATVYEIGPSPAAWVAYEAGVGSLETQLPQLPREARLQVIDDIAAAIDHATRHDVQPTQITPATVRIHETDGAVRATLAGWGLQWATRSALDAQPVTSYTAPEQLDDEVRPTTPVYQLAALAYRLLCQTPPFSAAGELTRAIGEGSPPVPSDRADLPPAVDTVLRRAMSPVPEQRYTRARTVSENLRSALD